MNEDKEWLFKPKSVLGGYRDIPTAVVYYFCVTCVYCILSLKHSGKKL